MIDPATALKFLEGECQKARVIKRENNQLAFDMTLEALETIIPLAKAELSRINAKAVLDTAKETLK